MHVTVRLFARLRELAGAGDLVLEVPDGSTVETVWERLAAAQPGLGAHRGSISAAVNADYAKLTSRVWDGDEVAFLPPVSGG
jgi:molybdopterin converting factor subunit 1